jgi:hypothetical protein
VAERGLLVASPKQRLRSTLRFSLAECSIIACEQAGYTEPLMANQVLINLLDWCKRERENLQCQLDARTFHATEDPGLGRWFVVAGFKFFTRSGTGVLF